jgi:hypothetical protein
LAFDIGAKAIDLLHTPKIDPEAVKVKIAEIQQLVLSAQRELNEAAEVNYQLKRALDDRAELRALEADMEYQQDGDFFIRKSERDGGTPIPYCATCWGETKKTIALKQTSNPGALQCIVHKTLFKTKSYMAREEEAIRQANQRRPRRFGGMEGMMR